MFMLNPFFNQQQADPIFNPPQADPALTLALLHFDGADGSTVFTDSSPYNKTFINFSGSPVISTEQSKFGGSSLKTNGSVFESIFYDAGDSNGDLNIGNSDFTMECWFYQTSITENVLGLAYINGDSGTRPITMFTYNGQLWIQIQLETGGSVLQEFNHQNAFSATTWNHVAVTRKGGFVHSYLNGTKSTSSINVGTDNLKSGVRYLRVGSGVYSLGGLDYSLNGYIDEFRFRKEAVYTGNFTPPTAPFTY